MSTRQSVEPKYLVRMTTTDLGQQELFCRRQLSAIVAADHNLAVKSARPASQMVHGRGDARIAARPVEAVPGQQSHAGGITGGHEAEAVELDLMKPARPAGRTFGRGWEAGTDEAGKNRARTREHEQD